MVLEQGWRYLTDDTSHLHGRLVRQSVVKHEGIARFNQWRYIFEVQVPCTVSRPILLLLLLLLDPSIVSRA